MEYQVSINITATRSLCISVLQEKVLGLPAPLGMVDNGRGSRSHAWQYSSCRCAARQIDPTRGAVRSNAAQSIPETVGMYVRDWSIPTVPPKTLVRMNLYRDILRKIFSFSSFEQRAARTTDNCNDGGPAVLSDYMQRLATTALRQT